MLWIILWCLWFLSLYTDWPFCVLASSAWETHVVILIAGNNFTYSLELPFSTMRRITERAGGREGMRRNKIRVPSKPAWHFKIRLMDSIYTYIQLLYTFAACSQHAFYLPFFLNVTNNNQITNALWRQNSHVMQFVKKKIGEWEREIKQQQREIQLLRFFHNDHSNFITYL